MRKDTWIPADPSEYSRMTPRDLAIETARTAYDNSLVLYSLQEDDTVDEMSKQLTALRGEVVELRQMVASLVELIRSEHPLMAEKFEER